MDLHFHSVQVSQTTTLTHHKTSCCYEYGRSLDFVFICLFSAGWALPSTLLCGCRKFGAATRRQQE